MAKEAQDKLFEALKAHIAQLEAERERDRDRASGDSQAVLYRRLEAAARVSEWLSTRLQQDQTLPVPDWTLNAPAAFL
jgi:hypothetical protein